MRWRSASSTYGLSSPARGPCILALDDLALPVNVAEQRAALVDQPIDLAAVDVRVRDPVGPAVGVLVEDLLERDAVDEVVVLALREVAGVVVRVRSGDRRPVRAAVLDADARVVEELERVRDDGRVARCDDLD